MLHERTVPLVDHDAVAVRDESGTLVLYAERLALSQRAALRRYLLETLERQEGLAATVVVPAGATERVLAVARVSTPSVRPLSLVGAVLATLAAGLVVATFAAAVVVLLVEVRPDGQLAGPLVVAGGRPAAQLSPGAAELSPAPAGLPAGGLRGASGVAAAPLSVGLPVDVQGAVQQIAPGAAAPTAAAVPGPVVAPAGSAPVAPAAASAGSSQPVSSSQSAPVAAGAGLSVPDVRVPDVKVPDVRVPVDLPDVDLPDVEVPDVEVPDVDLPDVDAPDVDLPDVDLPDVDLPDVKGSDESDEPADKADDDSDSRSTDKPHHAERRR